MKKLIILFISLFIISNILIGQNKPSQLTKCKDANGNTIENCSLITDTNGKYRHVITNYSCVGDNLEITYTHPKTGATVLQAVVIPGVCNCDCITCDKINDCCNLDLTFIKNIQRDTVTVQDSLKYIVYIDSIYNGCNEFTNVNVDSIFIGVRDIGNLGLIETCADNIQNQNETGIDCGGVCPVCIVDNDNDGTNSDTDPDDNDPCVPSNTVAQCDTDNDGVSDGNDSCPTVAGLPANLGCSCTDGVQNGAETGIDCGGGCPSCTITLIEPCTDCTSDPRLSVHGFFGDAPFSTRFDFGCNGSNKIVELDLNVVTFQELNYSIAYPINVLITSPNSAFADINLGPVITSGLTYTHPSNIPLSDPLIQNILIELVVELRDQNGVGFDLSGAVYSETGFHFDSFLGTPSARVLTNSTCPTGLGFGFGYSGTHPGSTIDCSGGPNYPLGDYDGFNFGNFGFIFDGVTIPNNSNIYGTLPSSMSVGLHEFITQYNMIEDGAGNAIATNKGKVVVLIDATNCN